MTGLSRRRPAHEVTQRSDLLAALDSSGPTLIEELESDPHGAQDMAAARFAVSVHVGLGKAVDACGYTGAELAGKLGVTDSAVSQVLNGDGNFRVATIARYARACGYQAYLGLEPVDESAPHLDLKFAFSARRSDFPTHWAVIEPRDGSKWVARSNVVDWSIGRLIVETEFTPHVSVPVSGGERILEFKTAAPNISSATS